MTECYPYSIYVQAHNKVGLSNASNVTLPGILCIIELSQFVYLKCQLYVQLGVHMVQIVPCISFVMRARIPGLL